jgi:hypothetical protein
VVAVLIAACTHLLNTGYDDWNAGADTAYVLLLLWLFFSKERIEDERVRELKLKAMFIAFAAGWAVAGALRFMSYLQDRSVPPRTLSAYDVMFAMLIIAHALFQYWRYQDGRQSETATQ